ncbi:NACHT domain- and WD repeat-containing protein 1 [Ornithorhynchus anatinus]|uniref:NACHT domain- and WD repeat-containing protein 1 n=1 Tax=Ornithorhynchus anatinus TaxID=9258 RepID=UPI0010A88F40|nr:NACHT domain- and WD repeat-containing protein 1 [Ornithorhynchus anatinus]
MDTEREALLEGAYPEVENFCQKHGLMFEVIDLRWGVRDFEAADHMMVELCLEEIKLCQEISAGPTFIALVGDRYGRCPLPRLIGEKEFDALSSQLTGNTGYMRLLVKWFWKDENAIPPAYTLQPITTHLPCYQEKRWGEREAWRREESLLATVLHSAAQAAEKHGLISKEEERRYHKSAIEWEIEEGLPNKGASKSGVTIFLREINDLKKHILDSCNLPVVDRQEDGCLDVDAQNSLTNLKGRIADEHPNLLKVQSIQWSKDLVNPRNKAHAQYLEKLGVQFIATVKHQILESLHYQKQVSKELGWLFQELRHHMTQCTERCRIFSGRQELVSEIGQRIRENDNNVHTPLIVFGPLGIGKTALMCKLSEQVQDFLSQETVIVLRLLGTSQLSSDIFGVLKSICFQVCLACGLAVPSTQDTAVYSDVVQFFRDLLLKVSRRNAESLVLLFDSIGELTSSYGAHRLSWLPKTCPPKVHLVVSTWPTEYGLLQALQEKVTNLEGYFEVKPLSGEQGREMMGLLLASVKRKLSPAQLDHLWCSLPECGHPLRLKLAFEEVQRWASYTVPSSLALTIREAVHQLCFRLEQLHGPVLVAHVLGYIVSSRNGLSEAELKDVLSLDNEVLKVVFQDWIPPSKGTLRFPPLLWAKLRRDLGGCLVKKPADGFQLLGLSHRQLTEVIQDRYLSGEEKTKRHLLLIEFFTGAWSQGSKKPITLPQLSKPLIVDRKVSAQPLWYSDTVANLRKLSELPYHLLNADHIEELKRDVLGNMNWISCRMISSGLPSILEDFALCAGRIDSPELQLVRDAIRLARSTIASRDGIDVSCFYTEILARLHSFSSLYPSLIGQLCHQCLSWFGARPHPILIPDCGFFQPPNGPLRTTLTGCHQGITAMEWSSANELLVVGSEDGTLVVWNMQDNQVVHILTGHTGEVRCVKVFGEGSYAISSSTDHTLRMWNLVSGTEKYAIWDGGSVNSGERNFCCLHLDEKNGIVYSASGSKLNAWKLETAELVFCILEDPLDIWIIAVVFACSEVVMMLSKGGIVSLWDSRTGKFQMRQRLSALKEETPSCGILIQKQEKVVVGFSNGSLCLISSEGNSLLDKVPAAVRFVIISQDESFLAAGFGKYVRVYLADSKVFRRFMAMDLEHENIVETAVVGPGNNVIVTGSHDEIIQIWSLSEQGTLLDILDSTGAPVTLFAVCGNILVSASRGSSSFKVWDFTYLRKHKPSAPFLDRTGCTALSHNGNYVYFPQIGNKNKVTIWNSVEGEEVDALDASNEVRCLEVAEQMQLLFTGLVSGTVLVFPLNSRQDATCIPPPETQKAINCMALSKGEERLVIGYDDAVLVLDIRTGEPYPLIDGPTYLFYTQLPTVISRVAVLADYRVVYGMMDGGLFLYNCPNSKVFSLEAHKDRITCLEISHKEQWAVSGSEESMQCLWDLEICKWEHEMSYKSSSFQGMQCACFSKDDKYIYAGLKDRSITVWNVSDGSLLAVQFVYAVVNKIIPTADGFIATTRLGYLIRERFHCPQSVSPHYNPLKNIKATCRVISRKRDEEDRKRQENHSRGPGVNQNRINKLSQICMIV